MGISIDLLSRHRKTEKSQNSYNHACKNFKEFIILYCKFFYKNHLDYLHY